MYIHQSQLTSCIKVSRQVTPLLLPAVAPVTHSVYYSICRCTQSLAVVVTFQHYKVKEEFPCCYNLVSVWLLLALCRSQWRPPLLQGSVGTLKFGSSKPTICPPPWDTVILHPPWYPTPNKDTHKHHKQGYVGLRNLPFGGSQTHKSPHLLGHKCHANSLVTLWYHPPFPHIGGGEWGFTLTPALCLMVFWDTVTITSHDLV